MEYTTNPRELYPALAWGGTQRTDQGRSSSLLFTWLELAVFVGTTVNTVATGIVYVFMTTRFDWDNYRSQWGQRRYNILTSAHHARPTFYPPIQIPTTKITIHTIRSSAVSSVWQDPPRLINFWREPAKNKHDTPNLLQQREVDSTSVTCHGNECRCSLQKCNTYVAHEITRSRRRCRSYSHFVRNKCLM